MCLCRLFPESRMTGLVTDRWRGRRTEGKRGEEGPSESYIVAWITAEIKPGIIDPLTCSCAPPFPSSVLISFTVSTLPFLLYFLLSATLLFGKPSVYVEACICAVVVNLSLFSNTFFVSFACKFLTFHRHTWQIQLINANV